eukprot:Opistho-2@20508
MDDDDDVGDFATAEEGQSAPIPDLVKSVGSASTGAALDGAIFDHGSAHGGLPLTASAVDSIAPQWNVLGSNHASGLSGLSDPFAFASIPAKNDAPINAGAPTWQPEEGFSVPTAPASHPRAPPPPVAAESVLPLSQLAGAHNAHSAPTSDAAAPIAHAPSGVQRLSSADSFASFGDNSDDVDFSAFDSGGGSLGLSSAVTGPSLGGAGGVTGGNDGDGDDMDFGDFDGFEAPPPRATGVLAPSGVHGAAVAAQTSARRESEFGDFGDFDGDDSADFEAFVSQVQPPSLGLGLAQQQQQAPSTAGTLDASADAHDVDTLAAHVQSIFKARPRSAVGIGGGAVRALAELNRREHPHLHWQSFSATNPPKFAWDGSAAEALLVESLRLKDLEAQAQANGLQPPLMPVSASGAQPLTAARMTSIPSGGADSPAFDASDPFALRSANGVVSPPPPVVSAPAVTAVTAVTAGAHVQAAALSPFEAAAGIGGASGSAQQQPHMGASQVHASGALDELADLFGAPSVAVARQTTGPSSASSGAANSADFDFDLLVSRQSAAVGHVTAAATPKRPTAEPPLPPQSASSVGGLPQQQPTHTPTRASVANSAVAPPDAAVTPQRARAPSRPTRAPPAPPQASTGAPASTLPGIASGGVTSILSRLPDLSFMHATTLLPARSAVTAGSGDLLYPFCGTGCVACLCACVRLCLRVVCVCC